MSLRVNQMAFDASIGAIPVVRMIADSGGSFRSSDGWINSVSRSWLETEEPALPENGMNIWLLLWLDDDAVTTVLRPIMRHSAWAWTAF